MQSTNITCIYLLNHQKTFKRLYITYNSCCELIIKRKLNNVNNPYIILRISSSFNYHDEQIKTIFWEHMLARLNTLILQGTLFIYPL